MRRAITDAWLGKRATRVILPISDPYVTHHGALGSFTTIYAANERGAPDLIERIASLPGMELVLDRAEACRRSELPEDRIGDIVAISCQDVVIGSSVSRHDLCGLDAPPRSHGGLSSRRSDPPQSAHQRRRQLGAAAQLRCLLALNCT
jgi:phosphonoacetate hydrolase